MNLNGLSSSFAQIWISYVFFWKCEYTTVCVEDCGLNSQKYWYNNFFACFIGKLDSSHLEIEKKIKAWALKKQFGLMLGVNTDMLMQVLTRATIFGIVLNFFFANGEDWDNKSWIQYQGRN